MVRGKKVTQRLLNKEVTAAEVSYKVKLNMNTGPDCLCELSCWWCQIDN